jgi:hypothetical protein
MMTALDYFGWAILSLAIGGLSFFIAINVGMLLANLNFGSLVEVD